MKWKIILEIDDTGDNIDKPVVIKEILEDVIDRETSFYLDKIDVTLIEE